MPAKKKRFSRVRASRKKKPQGKFAIFKANLTGRKGLGVLAVFVIFLVWIFNSSPKYTSAELYMLAKIKERYSGFSVEYGYNEAYEVGQKACEFLARETGVALFNTYDAKMLLLGTACAETNLRSRFQDGNGYAAGLYQVEYATFKDVWNRQLATTFPGLKSKIILNYSKDGKDIKFENLITDAGLCAIIARLYYYGRKGQIPSAEDIEAQAHYYKTEYNTLRGKGSVARYIACLQSARKKSERK